MCVAAHTFAALAVAVVGAVALRGTGVDAVVGDVRDPATLADASHGCGVVISAIHGFTAGRGISPATIDRNGNIALVRAAVDAGVEHLVLTSVYGAAATHPMSLDRMKYAAEQAFIGSGLRWTIIRPTPFLETWIDLIGVRLPDGGKALVFGRGDNPINFVSARDVANVIEHAVHDQSLRDGILDVTGPNNLTFNQIADRLAAAIGSPTRTSHIPLAALRTMALLAIPVASAFARQAQAAVVMNTTDMTIHDGSAFRQRTTLDELLRERDCRVT